MEESTKNLASQEELIKFLSFKLDISEALVKRIIQELINFIVLSLLKGCPLVNIQRFGTFKLETIKNNNPEGLDNVDNLNMINKTIVFQANTILSNILNYYYNSLEQDKSLGSSNIKEVLAQLNYFKEDTLADIEEDLRIGSKINTNKPDSIRTCFMLYLRHSFPYKESWTHPVTDCIYPFELVKASLEVYKQLNRENYRALWALWTSQQSRAFIAEHFNYSSSSLKRRWNKAIDAILLIMCFPTVHPSIPLNLYEIKIIEE